MSNIKELANITYDNIFNNNSHYFNPNIENIKEYILNNQKMLTNQLDKFLFISELKEKLGVDKIELIIEQEKKYGQILVANYKEIYELYLWFVDLVEKHYEQDIKEDINTYKWEVDEEKIRLLFEKLIGNFISPETGLKTFKFLFSGKSLYEAENKIDWLKISINKQPNKKSISDLIYVLKSKKIISSNRDIRTVDEIKILDTLFSFKKEELKFTNSNLANNNSKSIFRKDFENIIDSIL